LLEVLEQPAEVGLWEARWVRCYHVNLWLRDKSFVIDYGNDYWAGPDGEIHSS
jgi:hypothetical protein